MKKRSKEVKKLSGFEKKTLDIIKELEDARLCYYRRNRMSKRTLRVAGKLGVKESEAQKAISSRLMVGPRYAQSLFQSLYNEGFLTKSDLDFYSSSPEAIEAMGLVLRKRGYLKEAVTKLLRRELSLRGMTKEMREHRSPQRTKVIPPIIGHF